MKKKVKKTVTEEIGEPVIPDIGAIYHIVVKGETLYGISKKYNTTVQDIKSKNGLENNIISIGQKLRIQ